MRRVLASMAGLAALPWVLEAPAPARERNALAIVGEIRTLIEDGPLRLRGSPALCQGAGATPYEKRTEAWYFAEGDCYTTHRWDPGAIVTSPSEGNLGWLVDRSETWSRLRGLLSDLEAALPKRALKPEDRLPVQSAVWELFYGFINTAEGRPQRAADLKPVACQCLRIMKASAFAADEARLLPSNLKELPRLAGAPEIAALVDDIMRHDPGVVEVVPSTDLHADMLFGRFTPRLFLTVREPGEREALRRFLEDPSTPYTDLRNLPHKFAGIQAVLVLYFNVLTRDWTIVPTDHVAAWQEYAFSGTTDSEVSFIEAAARIEFLTIEGRWALGGEQSAGSSIAYVKANQGDPSTQGLLGIRPQKPGMWLTTKRGQCLRCHSRKVATFDTHGVRRAAFERPLSRPLAEIVSSYYQDKVVGRIGAWVAECAAGHDPRSSPGFGDEKDGLR